MHNLPWSACLVIGLAACGSSSPAIDAAADSPNQNSDGTVDMALASTDGTLVLTKSNGSGENALLTTLTVPDLNVGLQGVMCNANTAPTLCSFYLQTYIVSTMSILQSYEDFQSFADGTSDPLVQSGSTSTGMAIVFWKEDNNRWDATSGNFVIDHREGGLITFHINAVMAPHPTAPGSATGTWNLSAVATKVKFSPP